MTFSKLTAYTIPHRDKYSSRGGAGIVRLNLHHWAGTSGGIERMKDPKADVSCNYLILSDGMLVGQVPEEYRAWTSGSPGADNPAITVEVQNSGGRPAGVSNDLDPRAWPVTDAAFKTLCALLADLYTRYRWADMGESRLRGHREFASTACPGGYLWARRDRARADALASLKTIDTQIGDIEMRTLYNIDNKNEDTRRATVGEFTFKVERAAVNTRTRKLWGAPVNVTQGEWDAEIAGVNQRRKMVGLEPIKGVPNEFYDPAAGDTR